MKEPFSNTLKNASSMKDDSLTLSFVGDSNIHEIFSAINFDCLLHINEEICPLFVLKFYKSVRITRNRDQTISIAFDIKNQEIVLPLHQFAEILRVPCEGVYMYMVDWSIASLSKSIDSNPVYLTLLDDPTLVRDTIFNIRPSPTRYTKKGEMIVRDPFQTELSEMNPIFKKWETILSENVISFTGNKDHPNACLVYMLYCLVNQRPFNLAYYMTKRMVGVIKNDVIVLPYVCFSLVSIGMLPPSNHVL
ncbi:hypothetical protein Tco_0195233 [Tanacetum coccineum]